MTAPLHGIVASVAQEEITMALVSQRGEVDASSLRRWTRNETRTISDAAIAFKQAIGLRQTDIPSAIAVAGPVHGETVAVTHSAWIVTTSGLAAIWGRAPIILNDFEAMAWAVMADMQSVEPVAGPRIDHARTRARRFCLVGIDAGLGVAAFGWDESGKGWVLPSEAGDAAFPAVSEATRSLVADLSGAKTRCASDVVLSHAGFEAIRRLRAATRPANAASPSGEPHQRLCALATLEFCANLALVFGAWDGIVLTGRECARIRSVLPEQYAAGAFASGGAHVRKLRQVPVAYIPPKHSPLAGAAIRLMGR